MPYLFKIMPSPVGDLTLVAKDGGIAAILWADDRVGRVKLGVLQEDSTDPLLCEAERQLNEYFAGERKIFTLTLNFSGTDFQQKVWQALLTIPFGETRSYSNIAHQIGNPKAVRAVGAANGRNPISIIAPCHRVIGTNGTLTGFAGGLEAKRVLLELEAIDFKKGEKGNLKKSDLNKGDLKKIDLAKLISNSDGVDQSDTDKSGVDESGVDEGDAKRSINPQQRLF